jgi:NAD(P)H-hydrate epimerase
MKIFTAAQIKACDAYTIKAGGMRPYDLMEHAAGKCAGWIKENFPRDSLFVVLCGTGNNGGDGLALTRMLHQRGYGVKAFLLQFSAELSADCAENLERLLAVDKDLVGVVEPDKLITDIPRQIVIIDALLGTGLNRPVEGWLATFIKQINLLPNLKIAIDMPSGLMADAMPDAHATLLKCDHTLSFQFYKRTFLHAESAANAGVVHLLDIGLEPTFINATYSHFRTTEPADVKAIYRPRSPFGHKGNYGHALLVGGSYGKMGAITLCSQAALRAGAGLVTALTPACGYNILQVSAPEVMCRTNGVQALESIDEWQPYNATGIGPGMGTDSRTAAALAAFMDQCKQPLVIDADGLNLVARQPELLAKLPPGSVLTPHPREFGRLFGDSANSMAQLDQARTQAMRYNICIVLKGHHTAVVTPEGECWYNMTGNAGLAKGGAGDVLTGIITGLLAQGYAPPEAATLGVYLHGLAADIATHDMAQEALIASDVIKYLGKAIRQCAN